MSCFPSAAVHRTAARHLVSDLLYTRNENEHTLQIYELNLADGSSPSYAEDLTFQFLLC
jgi:hypothetical protein